MDQPSQKPKTVDNVVVTCMDYRFQAAIRQVLMNNHGVNLDQVDRLAIGGSSKAVADGTLTPSLQIAYKKHGGRNVYIFDHMNCGGFEDFGENTQKEIAAHFESLNQAKQAIKTMLPGLKVILYLVGMDGQPLASPTKQ